MAVSGKTAAPIEAPYALSTDKPPDVPALSKAMADRQHALLNGFALSNLAHGTAGQLIVVQSTGAAAYKALKGDATLAADGTLTIGTAAATSAKVKPTILTASLGSVQEIGTSYASLSGASFEVTPSVASTLLVFATFQFFASSGKTCTGTLSLDAVDQSQVVSMFVTAESGGAMATQVFALSLSAAKHTIAMRAKCAASSTGSAGTQTRMLGLLFAS